MSSKTVNPAILTTRQHYDLLDGLRGIAALAIVIFHFMEWIYPDPSKNFIGHGFLAVDFFSACPVLSLLMPTIAGYPQWELSNSLNPG
ncbi:MAG: hypothetical protein WC833_04015 [Bacteroidales bacterium]|jgi:hypothetical protein